MAIIDSDGLFSGKRLRRCSDKARLYFPYLFCLSNGFGRFELDFPKIIATAFLGFKEPPTEVELTAVIDEYQEQHLLFLYVSRGETWAVWDTRDKYLTRHKSTKDRESPIPPEPTFSWWKKNINNSSEISETRAVPNFPEVFAGFCPNARAPMPIPTPLPMPRPSAKVPNGEPGETRAWDPKPIMEQLFAADGPLAYPGSVKPDWDCQMYLSEINSESDERAFVENLKLHKATKQWGDGFVPSLENYLRKGQWKVKPRAEIHRKTQIERAMEGVDVSEIE